MSTSFDSIEVRLNGLLDDLRENLSATEVQEVRTFVDAGEYGVALETLQAILEEESKPRTEKLTKNMRELAREMGMSEMFDD